MITNNLPLHRLFVQIQNNGIFVGTAERLRVQQLLAASEGAWMTEAGREALKYEIAPLICRNRVEQDAFYTVYNAFLESLKEPLPPIKRSSFWEKWRKWLFCIVGLLLSLIIGLLIKANYKGKEQHKIAISFRSFDDRNTYKPGEKIVFKNTSFENIKDPLDTVGVRFVWKVFKEPPYKMLLGKYIPEKIDSSAAFSMVIPEPGRQNFTLTIVLEAYQSSNGDTLGDAYKGLVIECAHIPKVRDSILTEGVYKINQKIRFFAPRDAQKQWHAVWDFGDGEQSKSLQTEHVFKTNRTFSVSLSLSDTTQKGFCSTTIYKEIQISEEIPQLQAQTLYLDELKPYWAYTFLIWLIIFGALLVSLFNFWRWWNRQSITEPLPNPQISEALQRAFEPKDRAPYAIPYRSNNSQIRLAAEQMELANILRRRQSGQQVNLHIPRTIGATIEKMGFTELRFAQNTRPTQYLFLIDTQNEASHQAQLFKYLVEMLVGQEVLADVLFYKNDFNRFWNQQHSDGMSLEQVDMNYGDRRLIVFGDGYRLVSDTASNEVVHIAWSEGLKRWHQRMLITPTPVASWTYREARLYRIFGIFHADLQGLTQAAQFVDTGLDDEHLPPSFAEWERQCQTSQVDVDIERSWRSPDDHKKYIRETGQGDAMYHWLRALTIYPDLNWNVTIAIGRALGVEVKYEHLLTLARIPWLQEGTMKITLWRAWWQEIPKDEELKTREAIHTELQAVAEKSAEGYADQKLQIRVAVQDFALRPAETSAQDAMRFILSRIAPSPMLSEELDLVVARHQPDFFKKNGPAGSTVSAFLLQKPKVSRPFFNRHFWFGMLALPFFLLPILVGPAKWENLHQKYPRQTEWCVTLKQKAEDKAVELNNDAVKAWYENLKNFNKNPWLTTSINNTFNRQSADVAQLFVDAMELRGKKYPLAQTNRARVFYNVGLKYLDNEDKTKQKSNSDRNNKPDFKALGKAISLSTDYFRRALDSDTLYVLAAEALAVAFYKNHQMDSACYWVKKVVAAQPDYFNWLEAKEECDPTAVFALNLLVLDADSGKPISDADARSKLLPALKSNRNGQINYVFPKGNAVALIALAIQKKAYAPRTVNFVPNTISRLDTIRLSRDSDGDGVPDRLDKCQGVMGIAPDGCPPITDRDGDGVPDNKDNCPDSIGTIQNKGCPDTDNDGIINSKDPCPTEAGTLANKGCPDTDNDGIIDREDPCPTEAGTLANKGCPDTDNDGIIDREDLCPKQAGPASNNGCPIPDTDTDGDGLMDKNDACPNTAGLAKFQGCANAIELLKVRPANSVIVLQAIQGFPFDKSPQVNIEEAKRILLWLGIVDLKIDQLNAEPFVSGTFDSGTSITIWVGTYGKKDRYGLRYGKPDLSYIPSNDSYFEIIRP